MNNTADRIFRFLRSLIIPEICLACGGSCSGTSELCRDCYELFIEESKEICPKCGCRASLCECGTDFSKHTAKIGGRKFAVLTFYKSRTDYPESDRLTEKMIYVLKSTGAYSDLFASLLAEEVRRIISEDGDDVRSWRVTYIPRTKSKKISGGVDQSEELAERIARRLNIPMDELFERDKGSEQKYLDKEARKENIEKSLYLRNSPEKGCKYLLIDDIITSGASVEAAARLLNFAGAQSVFPAAVCRNMQKEK